MIKKSIKPLVVAVAIGLSCGAAQASFYVDYQGTQADNLTAEELRRLKGAPEGYRLLTDKNFGLITEIGEGKPVKITSFGADISFKDAISMIMPEGWIAYIDENVRDMRNVDWQVNNESWLKALASIGGDYGYYFLVDWQQKLIQILPDSDYIPQEYNAPVEMLDEESGRKIFIYSSKPVDKGGVVIINGKAVPVKIIQ